MECSVIQRSLAILLLSLLFVASADAAEELYFTGVLAPLGSISAEGSGDRAVFLRWNEGESALPTDFDTWILRGGGVGEIELPVGAVMSESQIAALYATSADVRAKAEMIRWLDDLDEATAVTNANFAATLRARIVSDAYWSFLASRIDIRVAQARYRAFRDDAAPGNGEVEYELLVRSTGGSTRRVGRVLVDTNEDLIVPAATSFEQVRLGRCDAPETQKDHGVVTLDWDPAGGTVADRYAAAIVTAGYDLYRSPALEPVPPTAPLRDLRGEAAGQPANADGTVSLSGLVKVNDTPIVVSGAADRETNRRGYNAPFSQFQDEAESIASSGLKPGDTVAYYLVPRDLTGNYGATTAVLATIPDLRKPPAPWAVQTWSDSANDQFTLVWDQVDVRNYYDDYQRGRTYCNLATARFDRELRFVPEGETCESARAFEVELDIREYRVYRFERADQAESFRDSDGDGVADLDERELIPGLPGDPEGWTSPGSACDPGDAPVGADNFLIDAVTVDQAVQRASGRRVIQYRDDFPATRKSDVFWYRIASVSRSGEVGELSAPVRGLFRDRARPLRGPDLDGLDFGLPTCSYAALPLTPADPGLPFAIDDSTSGIAERVRARCDRGTPQAPLPYSVTLDVVDEATPGVRGALLPGASCISLVNSCQDIPDSEVQYLDESGSLLASLGYPNGFNQCPLANSFLEETCTPGLLRPIDPGERVVEPPVLDFPGAVDCVSLYREIGDTTARLRMICPGDWPVSLDLVDLSGELVCLSVAVHNANNVVSSKERLPCFRLPSEAPGPPQPTDLAFDPGLSTATIAWRPPNQVIAGTLVEWKDGDGSIRESRFVPHAGETTLNGEQQTVVDLGAPPLAPDSQQWCFRARSVGYAPDGGEQGQLSEWSASLCALRLPVGEVAPVYLPWPRIPEPPSGAPLDARYLTTDGLPTILLGEPLFISQASCDTPPPQPCSESVGCFPVVDEPFEAFCREFCSLIGSAIGESLGFVAYRQARPLGGGVESEFVQVTPLVDRAHCEYTNFSGRLEDPYVKYAFFGPGDPWDGERLVFVDRFPHVGGQELRYQLVYFGPDGEITGYRTSNWVVAP